MFSVRLNILLVTILATSTAPASPLYQPAGPEVTIGDVAQGRRVLLGGGNPASGAASARMHEDQARSGTLFSVGAGLEYGNVDELFDVIDRVSAAFRPSDPDSGQPPPPGQNPADKPLGGIELPDFGDLIDPELQAVINAASEQVVELGALLAVIAVEGYAKGNVNGDLPIVIGKEMLGGSWSLGLNVSGTAKAFGLADSIDFDPEAALEAIQDWANLQPDDPVTLFNSGDVQLWVDPQNNRARLSLKNDSLLLTKSAIVNELGFAYSRQAMSRDSGTLYWGAKAKYYYMRLSRVSARFGDITDADELFDAIRDADYQNDNGLSLDLGLLWVAPNYQLGATIVDINEPSFEFPAIDTSGYTDVRTIEFLLQDTKYEMERQLKLEGSVFTANRRWNFNFALDANAASDVMGDDYQWATASAGYSTDSWWLPGIRAGVRTNLAGTELTYVGLGLTAFKIVNLDVASTLDTVKISGTNLPTGLMASLGFEITF